MVVPKNERAAAKLKELEINMNMIQLKLFLDHSQTILNQVEALEIPLFDCIVMFNLRACPFSVEVKKWTEEFTTPLLKRGFEDSRSNDYIVCFFISCIFDWGLIEGQIPNLIMQRMFPHEWLRMIEDVMSCRL